VQGGGGAAAAGPAHKYRRALPTPGCSLARQPSAVAAAGDGGPALGPLVQEQLAE